MRTRTTRTKKRSKYSTVEKTEDFKIRIASICLGIPIEQVILNKNARKHEAFQKMLEKGIGCGTVRKRR